MDVLSPIKRWYDFSGLEDYQRAWGLLIAALNAFFCATDQISLVSPPVV